MGFRRKGRELAVQTLYSLEFIETDSLLQNFELLNHYEEKLDEIIAANEIETESTIYQFAKDLLYNSIKQMETIDNEISKYSTNWSFEKIAMVDKSVLRVAAYELMYTDTPAAIVMDEAIEISKKFCSENSKKFINGVLNALASKLTENKNG